MPKGGVSFRGSTQAEAKAFARSKSVRPADVTERDFSSKKIVKSARAGSPPEPGSLRKQTELIDAGAADAIVDLIRELRTYFTDAQREIAELAAQSYGKGYADGERAGKRQAKGKPPSLKARGGQKTLDDILALHFLDFVEASGGPPNAAAEAFRNGLQSTGMSQKQIPSREATIRLHKRMKSGKHKIEESARCAYNALRRSSSGS